MALDATPGGTSSDSFVTVADANSYFSERLHVSAWEDDAGISEKEKALKWATKILDRLPWMGYKATDTQALRWPRSFVYDLDGASYDETLIPAFLEQATCELAIELLGSNRTADNTAKQLRALTAGSIKLEFDAEYVKNVLPDVVYEIIEHALSASSSGIISMTVLRA